LTIYRTLLTTRIPHSTLYFCFFPFVNIHRYTFVRYWNLTTWKQ